MCVSTNISVVSRQHLLEILYEISKLESRPYLLYVSIVNVIPCIIGREKPRIYARMHHNENSNRGESHVYTIVAVCTSRENLPRVLPIMCAGFPQCF